MAYNNTSRAGRYGYVVAVSAGGLAGGPNSGFDGPVGSDNATRCPLTDWEAVFATELLDVTNFESPRTPVFFNDLSPSPVPLPENTWKQFTSGLSEGEVTLKGKVHEDWQFFRIGFPVGAIVTVRLGFRPVTVPIQPGRPAQYIQCEIRVSNGTIGTIVSGTADFTIKGKMNGPPLVINL